MSSFEVRAKSLHDINVVERQANLGKLIGTYATAPAFIQRAAVIAIVSFLFFLAMLLAFSAREQILYLVLAAAFLVVNIFTLIGFYMQKRNTVKVFEKGIEYGKHRVEWADLVAADIDSSGRLNLRTKKPATIVIPKTVDDIGKLDEYVRHQIP